MASPPSKRQKRLTAVSSDEDEQEEEDQNHNTITDVTDHNAGGVNISKNLPTRSRTKAQSIVSKPKLVKSSESTLSSLAENSRKRTKTTQKTQKSGSIYSFFNTATQSQRIGPKPESTSHIISTEREDIIQDDFPDERTQEEIDDGGGGQRISSDVLQGEAITAYRKLRANASQRFSARKSSVELNPAVLKDQDQRPWSEKYSPSTPEELAVHKKKVTDVRVWLENAFHGRDCKRLLILKGPSGSGKTAAISTLAKFMGFDISEWRNPISQEFFSEGFQSMSSQFDEFLGRSGKFGTLNLTGSNAQYTPDQDLEQKGSRKKIILLEDFPNTFTRTPGTLQAFRSSVLQYLVAATAYRGTHTTKQYQSSEEIPPLVMIISETLLTNTTSAADSFTTHRLLGADILKNPGVSVIEFNPVAATILAKALDLVVHKEARQSGRRRTPGAAVLKKLGEIGDIRSAIGSLQFLCIKTDTDSEWSGRVAGKAKKGTKNTSSITKMERESIEMITQREASLGIFHAVGKVVYNKRESVAGEDSIVEPPVQPPDHLAYCARPRLSQVSVNTLIDETGTDTQTFISALHENYVLSCGGSTAIDAINGCIEFLSDSDLLNPDRAGGFGSRGIHGGFGRGPYQGAGSDNTRQDELCFQVAVRGLLFALPCPVKRSTTRSSQSGRGGGDRKGDAFRMLYPTSLKLWKHWEEIESLVDSWIDDLMANYGFESFPIPGNNATTYAPGSVETWRTKSTAFSDHDISNESKEENRPPFLLVGRSVRKEMLLERLPYITKIERQKPGSTYIRDLERITQFHGIDAPNDDASDEDEDDAVATATEWTTQRPREPTPRNLSKGVDRYRRDDEQDRNGLVVALPVERAVEKLVLSDDDIEDD